MIWRTIWPNFKSWSTFLSSSIWQQAAIVRSESETILIQWYVDAKHAIMDRESKYDIRHKTSYINPITLIAYLKCNLGNMSGIGCYVFICLLFFRKSVVIVVQRCVFIYSTRSWLQYVDPVIGSNLASFKSQFLSSLRRWVRIPYV